MSIDLDEVADMIASELDVLAGVRDTLRDLEFTILDNIDNVSNAEGELRDALSSLEAAAEELSKNV